MVILKYLPYVIKLLIVYYIIVSSVLLLRVLQIAIIWCIYVAYLCNKQQKVNSNSRKSLRTRDLLSRGCFKSGGRPCAANSALMKRGEKVIDLRV